MKRSVFKTNKCRFGLFVAAGRQTSPPATSPTPTPAPAPKSEETTPAQSYPAAIEPIEGGAQDPGTEGDTVSIDDERSQMKKLLAQDKYGDHKAPEQTATSNTSLTIEEYAKAPQKAFDEAKKQAWGVRTKQNPAGQVTGYEVTGAAKGILNFDGTNYSVVNGKETVFKESANELIMDKILEAEPGFADWPESRQFLYVEALQKPEKKGAAVVAGRVPLDQLDFLQQGRKLNMLSGNGDANAFISKQITGSQRDNTAAKKALDEFQELNDEGRWDLAYYVRANGMEAKDLLKLLDADGEGKSNLEATEKELNAKDGKYQNGAEVSEGYKQGELTRTKEIKTLREEMESLERTSLNATLFHNDTGLLTEDALNEAKSEGTGKAKAYALQDKAWDKITKQGEELAKLEDELKTLKGKKDETDGEQIRISSLNDKIKEQNKKIAGLNNQFESLEADGGWLDRHDQADKLVRGSEQIEADFAKGVFEANPGLIKKHSGVKPILTDKGKEVHKKNTLIAKAMDEVEDARQPITKFKDVLGDVSAIFTSIKGLTEDGDSDKSTALADMKTAINDIRTRMRDRAGAGKTAENLKKIMEAFKKEPKEGSPGSALAKMAGLYTEKTAAERAEERSHFKNSRKGEAETDQAIADAKKAGNDADLTEQRVDDFTTRRVGKRQYFV